MTTRLQVLALVAVFLGIGATVWWYNLATIERNAHQSNGECCVGFQWSGFAQYTVIDCRRWVPCALLIQPPPSDKDDQEPVG